MRFSFKAKDMTTSACARARTFDIGCENNCTECVRNVCRSHPNACTAQMTAVNERLDVVSAGNHQPN